MESAKNCEFFLQKEINRTFMIRSVRQILSVFLKIQMPTDEVFSTLMAEVKGLLNSRLLVPVVMNPIGDEPLTPNHLLLMRGDCTLPSGLVERKDCYAKQRWKQIHYLANQFWVRWVREFLPNLNLRQKWFKVHGNVARDDLVLLVDDLQHRSKWLLGRIVETYADKKGHVRTMLVKT